MTGDYLIHEEDGVTLERKTVPQIYYHKVEEGDTFRSIAKYYYGNEKFCNVLMHYNQMNAPEELKVGMTIEIPIM